MEEFKEEVKGYMNEEEEKNQDRIWFKFKMELIKDHGGDNDEVDPSVSASGIQYE